MSELLHHTHPTKLECVDGLKIQMSNLIGGRFSKEVEDILKILTFSIGINHYQNSCDHFIPEELIGKMRRDIEEIEKQNMEYDEIGRKIGDPY